MSLNRWVHRVNVQGVAALKPATRAGRPSRLTPALGKLLARDLDKSPQTLGLNRAQWDGPTLVTYLKRRWGVTLKVRQAQYWMHQLGYRMKRARYTYLQARGEDARRFQRALKENPPARVGMRRWFFMTGRVSACLPDWDEAGRDARCFSFAHLVCGRCFVFYNILALFRRF